MALAIRHLFGFVHWRASAIALAVALLCYFAFAYFIAPSIWRHFERQHGLETLPMTTSTAQGIPGDALNVGLEGAKDDVICALAAAGWLPADPVTLRSSVKIIRSVLLDRAYVQAPVSPLFYGGRSEDMAFEKAFGTSPTARHHVRLWKVSEAGDDGRPAWIGAATFDQAVGLSHTTGQVTHHIAADIDAERDELSNNLRAAGKVAAAYKVSGVGPTFDGRNGSGDAYFTDGDIQFSALSQGCEAKAAKIEIAEDTSAVSLKNAIYAWIVGATNLRARKAGPPESANAGAPTNSDAAPPPQAASSPSAPLAVAPTSTEALASAPTKPVEASVQTRPTLAANGDPTTPAPANLASSPRPAPAPTPNLASIAKSGAASPAPAPTSATARPALTSSPASNFSPAPSADGAAASPAAAITSASTPLSKVAAATNSGSAAEAHPDLALPPAIARKPPAPERNSSAAPALAPTTAAQPTAPQLAPASSKPNLASIPAPARDVLAPAPAVTRMPPAPEKIVPAARGAAPATMPQAVAPRLPPPPPNFISRLTPDRAAEKAASSTARGYVRSAPSLAVRPAPSQGWASKNSAAEPKLPYGPQNAAGGSQAASEAASHQIDLRSPMSRLAPVSSIVAVPALAGAQLRVSRAITELLVQPEPDVASQTWPGRRQNTLIQLRAAPDPPDRIRVIRGVRSTLNSRLIIRGYDWPLQKNTTIRTIGADCVLDPR